MRDLKMTMDDALRMYAVFTALDAIKGPVNEQIARLQREHDLQLVLAFVASLSASICLAVHNATGAPLDRIEATLLEIMVNDPGVLVPGDAGER